VYIEAGEVSSVRSERRALDSSSHALLQLAGCSQLRGNQCLCVPSIISTRLGWLASSSVAAIVLHCVQRGGGVVAALAIARHGVLHIGFLATRTEKGTGS